MGAAALSGVVSLLFLAPSVAGSMCVWRGWGVLPSGLCRTLLCGYAVCDTRLEGLMHDYNSRNSSFQHASPRPPPPRSSAAASSSSTPPSCSGACGAWWPPLCTPPPGARFTLWRGAARRGRWLSASLPRWAGGGACGHARWQRREVVWWLEVGGRGLGPSWPWAAHAWLLGRPGQAWPLF